MLFGKLIETAGNDVDCMLNNRVMGVLLSLQLYDQTLLQVSSRNSRRIKTLYLQQHFFNFIQISYDILAKGDDIEYSIKISSDVAIIYNTSKDLMPDDILILLQFLKVQLSMQRLMT